MGTRLLLALLVTALTGCLFETPEHVVPGAELEALADGDASTDSGDDPGDVDAESPDVAPDLPDVTVPQTFSYECDPPCGEGEFCGPDSTCYRGAPSCTATNQTCDPAVAPTSPELFCESAYDGSVGYCRRRCTVGEGCPDGESCGAVRPGSDVTVCRRTCQDDDECLALDRCTASRFGYCRAGCVPFYDGQCDDETQCLPTQADAGFCDVRGEVPVDGVCDVAEGLVCVAGALCLTTAAGNRCIQGCNPAQEADEPGGCGGGRNVCGELQGRTLGICAQTCDIFDAQRQCDAPEQGCTYQGGTGGVCFHRGARAVGQSCDGHQDCVGNLACVDSMCRPLCLRTAGAGEEGACDEGLRCRTLSGPSLGYCIP